MSLPLSVVIATYNRSELLLSLLHDLARQDVAPGTFEVVLVDDGSDAPVRGAVEALSLGFPLRVVEQANAGQAAARDNGIRCARGEIVVVLDDDMRLPEYFLSEHLALHRAGNSLVLGHIRSSPQLRGMPLFERFHARQLDAFVDAMRNGEVVRGAKLCTGNVSFRRADYLAIGGFDRTLKRSEDRDLGIRLELHGARIAFSERAHTTHHSDHTDLNVWLRRARLYGRYDSIIARKHEELEYIDPWHFIFDVNPISRPLLLLVTAAPALGGPLSRTAMAASHIVDRFGFPSLAVAGTTLAYGIEYFAGMREQAGTLGQSWQALTRYLAKRRLAPKK